MIHHVITYLMYFTMRAIVLAEGHRSSVLSFERAEYWSMGPMSSPGQLGWQRAAKEIKHCFQKVLNGPYWDRSRVVHCCIGGCCSTREEAESKVASAILRVIMRCVPVTPSLADWVRLGPNLDFFLCAEFQGILTALLLNAEWAMNLPQQDLTGEVVFVEWRKLAGSRFHRTRHVLVNAAERFQRVLLAIVMEPLRHLHSAFLRHAHTAPDDQAWPLLLAEMWGPSSKFMIVRQYLSALLAGDGSRLRLMWQWDGCTSMSHWLAEHPDQGRQARNLILLVAGSVHRRFATTLYRFPFKLFSVADARRCDHESVINEFYSKPFCCLQPGCAREIRKTIPREEFVERLPHFRWFSLLMTFITKATVAGVERRHATHKQQANRGMPFHMFAAGSIVSECKQQASAVDRMKQERWEAQQSERLEEGLEADSAGQSKATARRSWRRDKKEDRLIRASSALDIFKVEWHRREKALGRNWNSASAECWAACKAAFTELPQNQRDVFCARANASKIQAAVNRKIIANRGSPDADLEGGPDTNLHLPEADSLAIMIQNDTMPSTVVRQRKPPMPKHLAVQSLLAPFLQQAQDGNDGIAKQRYPIDPAELRARSKAQGGMRKAIETFEKQATTIAGGEAVPDKVVYPGWCGALCRMQNTQRTVKLRTNVVDALQRIVRDSGLKPGWFSQASIVLAAEQYQSLDDPTPCNVTFYALIHACGRQAHHKAQVTLAELESLFCPPGIQAVW